MSEVDGLSNSGLYPALPAGDRRRSEKEFRSTTSARAPSNEPIERASGDEPRPPRSLIDEYA